MQKTSTAHLIIVILLMVITGLAVYIIVTPTATAPTNSSTDATPTPVTPENNLLPNQTTPTPPVTVAPDLEVQTVTDNSLALTTGRWNWRGTNGPGRSVLSSVPDRNPFMLTFTADGTASSATDCNSMSGSYTTDGEETISFGDFAMTMMYCEDSKEYEYSQQLNQVERFTFSDSDTLQLHLADDAGVMIFSRID